MTNLEWLKTLSAEELADWFYDEWLHHLQYRWSSSRGGLIIWLKDRKTEPTISKMEQVEEPQTDKHKCRRCLYYDISSDYYPCSECVDYSNYSGEVEVKPQTERSE